MNSVALLEAYRSEQPGRVRFADAEMDCGFSWAFAVELFSPTGRMHRHAVRVPTRVGVKPCERDALRVLSRRYRRKLKRWFQRLGKP